MAYSEYATQLPLDRFFEIVGIHPLHGNQLKTPTSFASDRPVGCASPIYQHRYQSDNGTPGRNEIARAIAQAERDIEQLVHFPLIKRWITNEQIPLVHGRPVQLEWGHIVSPGIRVATLIEDDASVSTEDEDEDGFEETAVVTVTLNQTTYDAIALGSFEELRVFYPGKNADPTWEIRPVRLSVNSVTREVEIRFNTCQLVDPKFYERMVPGVLDPEDDVYLDKVDVYRLYNDPTIETAYTIYCQGQPSDISTAGAIVSVRSAVGSIIAVGTPILWPDVCMCVVDPSARFSYVAGFPGSTFTRMAHPLENAVAMLAMSRLGGICACAGPDYARDLSIVSTTSTTQGNIEQTRWATPPARVMKNPFGTSEGARMVYDIIVTEILGETGNSYR